MKLEQIERKRHRCYSQYLSDLPLDEHCMSFSQWQAYWYVDRIENDGKIRSWKTLSLQLYLQRRQREIDIIKSGIFSTSDES